jgi:hypothetical protein
MDVGWRDDPLRPFIAANRHAHIMAGMSPRAGEPKRDALDASGLKAVQEDENPHGPRP